ncbi:MAG: DUF1329 domain-containing protein [Telmatospirillum sp.]|nr:DUF1329 domain-containing protein [Telmatospirillum sp.]
MRRIIIASLAGLLAAGCLLPSARAEMTADEIKRLGADLTPTGAEKAGNKDGSIPAWDGGLTRPPADFAPEKGYSDPFAQEKPLFTITGETVDQYRDRLAPGQIELLKRYPTYKMVVYPSHRTAALPQAQYDVIRTEGKGIQLVADGNGLANVTASTVPFPLPKSGVEVMWNHLMRFRGGTVNRWSAEFPVQADGSVTPVKRSEWWAFASALGNPEPNRLAYYLNAITGPSSMAGETLLVHETLNQVQENRRAWTYNPGQRRVLRAPEISYDSPGQGSDGLRTVDDYDGFNGAPDRYDWKLIGKREMIIAYNNYRLTDKSLKYKDIVLAHHLNQDLVRYEPHRVWVVEATLKPNVRHIYGKRVFYFDEDSWQVALADEFDGRGELWRVHEVFAIQYYDALVPWLAADAQYDLQSRRYLANYLANEEKPIRFGGPMDISRFQPDSLRRMSN